MLLQRPRPLDDHTQKTARRASLSRVHREDKTDLNASEGLLLPVFQPRTILSRDPINTRCRRICWVLEGCLREVPLAQKRHQFRHQRHVDLGVKCCPLRGECAANVYILHPFIEMTFREAVKDPPRTKV